MSVVFGILLSVLSSAEASSTINVEVYHSVALNVVGSYTNSADWGSFLVSRTGDTTGQTSVSISVSGIGTFGGVQYGTDSQAGDYQLTGSVGPGGGPTTNTFAIFNAGQTEIVIAVQPVYVPYARDAKTVIVTLLPPGPGTPPTLQYFVGSSNTATVTIYSLPIFTVQPQVQVVGIGGTAAFSVAASGQGTLSYQWQRNGVALNGSTNATLLLTNVSQSLVGEYSAVVANFAGSVTSTVAQLTVLLPGQIGTKVWSFVASSPPTTAAIGRDGTIYFGANNRVYALDKDGNQRWEFVAENTVNEAVAIGGDGTLYFGAGTNKLYALTPSGSNLWTFIGGGQMDSIPAIAPDGTVYCGSVDGKLYAMTPSGAKKWGFQTGGRVISSPSIRADGTIIVGSEDGKVYCLAADGTSLWQFATHGGV